MMKPKKPPRTKIPRGSWWHCTDGTGFDQDAVERAMKEIRSTVEFLLLSEKETASADATQEDFASLQAAQAALRRRAEELVLGWWVLEHPGGRSPSDHREEWLKKYDARRKVDKSLSLRAICRQIYDDHEEEFLTPVGDRWRQASFEAVYRYIRGQ